ncbi:hypothetical protein C8F04DRAFT_1235791 [Mycena alexandri]|uniref:Uncharacterized protein n=1 Tax=Mycena alexandri TaxID=1745969 RepID=A0AAD6SQ83_9AGAR|nr:hypothetical protein C8F04DRAFT_1235791 [Mycena alexandri]
MAHSVLPPDRLPFELWQQIATHVIQSPRQDHGWVVSQLLPWLAVAPLSLARNMHGAAFSLIFRRVWWNFDGRNGVADRALVSRALERDEEYLLAIRSLKLSTPPAGSEKAETEIVPVLLEALVRFLMLREFSWDGHLGPIPLSVLQTLLSANRELVTLSIGATHSAISPVDLSGFLNLVNLEVYYSKSVSLELGRAQILCPHSLRSLEFDLYSDDRDAVAFEALVDNALSLCVLRLGGPCIIWDLGNRESSYTFLHTVSLILITPPPDTGLDFTHLPTLTSLTLDSITNIQNFGSLPICIRTPHTLRHLDLSNIEPVEPGTSILGGVHLASLDSLALWEIPLTQEDMNLVFAPQFSRGTISSASPTLSPCMLKKLELQNPVDPSLLAVAIQSSHPFPALLHLRFDIASRALLDSLPLFLSRANALQQLELEDPFRFVVHGIKAPSFLSPPSVRTAFKAAERLRHISLPIHRLELRHPIFHELGEALQHISSLTLTLQEQWDPQPHLIENTFKAFSKF